MCLSRQNCQAKNINMRVIRNNALRQSDPLFCLFPCSEKLETSINTHAPSAPKDIGLLMAANTNHERLTGVMHIRLIVRLRVLVGDVGSEIRDPALRNSQFLLVAATRILVQGQERTGRA